MIQLPRLAACLLFISLPVLGLPAQADEGRYNQVALRAEVSQDVAHDQMTVTLYSEAQDRDPAKLAALITRQLNAAVSKARQAKGVEVSLGSRNSYPVYDDQGKRISAWRERGEVQLRGQDFASLAELTASLLGELQMGGMSFSISSATRQHSEDLLLKDAVAAFKARAQLATAALGGSGYRLVSLNLNSAGFQPPMPMRMAAMKSMADAAPVPEIEAGSSQVTVSADGVIEVQMP